MPSIVEVMTADAMNCPAVRPISGSSVMILVMSPVTLPYLLRKYSGTVLTSVFLTFGAMKLMITKAIPMVMMYHEALRP